MCSLKFHGYSDDMAYVREVGTRWSEEVPLSDGEHAVFCVESPSTGEAVCVTLCYLDDAGGVWTVGLAPLGPLGPIPDWPTAWSVGDPDYEANLELAMQALAPMPPGNYTMVLTLDAPDDATVQVLRPTRHTEDADA